MKKKPMSAGERIIYNRLKKTLPDQCKTIEDFRQRGIFNHARDEAKAYDRAIKRAVKAEYTRMLSLASNLAASSSVPKSNRPRVKIEDLKLPKTWGTIRTPAKVKVRKARK